ncbi:TPA: hypothetical protein ACOWQJ_003233 [Providencia rettgeri]
MYIDSGEKNYHIMSNSTEKYIKIFSDIKDRGEISEKQLQQIQDYILEVNNYANGTLKQISSMSDFNKMIIKYINSESLDERESLLKELSEHGSKLVKEEPYLKYVFDVIDTDGMNDKLFHELKSIGNEFSELAKNSRYESNKVHFLVNNIKEFLADKEAFYSDYIGELNSNQKLFDLYDSKAKSYQKQIFDKCLQGSLTEVREIEAKYNDTISNRDFFESRITHTKSTMRAYNEAIRKQEAGTQNFVSVMAGFAPADMSFGVSNDHQINSLSHTQIIHPAIYN